MIGYGEGREGKTKGWMLASSFSSSLNKSFYWSSFNDGQNDKPFKRSPSLLSSSSSLAETSLKSLQKMKTPKSFKKGRNCMISRGRNSHHHDHYDHPRMNFHMS